MTGHRNGPGTPETRMLSHAGAEMGRGKAFAIHEALDQSAAVLGPLLVGLMVAISGFQLGFGVLAIPGAAALVAVMLLRRAAPDPARYDTHLATEPARAPGQARVRVPLPARFWWYGAFTAVSMFGFSTFGVISYHLEVQKVMPSALIPVTYAVSVGAVAHAPRRRRRPRPRRTRGTGYGIITAIYGIAWLAGSTIIGALYPASLTSLIIFTVTTQFVALIAFIPLLRPAPGPGTRHPNCGPRPVDEKRHQHLC